MLTILMQALAETYHIAVESAPYILFGFIMAGLLSVFFPQDRIQGWLGQKSIWSVLKASIIGVPLPLCSCGVIPAAVALRRKGASRGATASFLISTPETGAESILLTYGLMGPFMTIIRPIAAFITAATAGVLVNSVDDSKERPVAETPSCCCGSKNQPAPRQTFLSKLWGSIVYVFNDLLGDIGKWLVIGIVISGVIMAVIPEQFFTDVLGSNWLTMAVMLVIGLPLYICASASTPVAAALMLKGVSPGAALVLLMVGPATNVSTIAIVAKEMGKRAAAFYLGSIVVCSLVIAIVVDWLVAGYAISIPISLSTHHHMLPLWIGIPSAVILFGLIGYHMVKRALPKKQPAKSCCSSEGVQIQTTGSKSDDKPQQLIQIQ
jgi:uncharacterized membrane protein YraQ (UPF0718 family)